MSVKKSIFGSRSEERGFRSIEHTWGGKYRIIPQFPWSAIFTPDPRWRDTSNLFFKTSVDYLLATDKGQPLLAIDFDGMGNGYDREGEYVQMEPTDDRNRKAKFDFKLQFARINEFPYHIVASEEFHQLGDGIELTLVDAIIASAIAHNYFVPQTQSPSTGRELVNLRMHCEFEHNPIVGKMIDVMNEISAITGEPCEIYPSTLHFFTEPEWPDVFAESVPTGLAEMKRWFTERRKEIERIGCVATIDDTPVGEVSDVTTFRAIGAAKRVDYIAWLLVYSKLLRLLKRKV